MCKESNSLKILKIMETTIEELSNEITGQKEERD